MAKAQEFKATERIEAPQGGPGRGPMGGGMVGQKAMQFVPSGKRLAARLRPDRGKTVLVVLLGVVSVLLMSIGPRPGPPGGASIRTVAANSCFFASVMPLPLPRSSGR